MAEKKEFAWDSEVVIGSFEVSTHDRRDLKIATLNGKEFVVITQVKKIKDEWKPVKNSTIPKSIWSGIVDAVEEHDLGTIKGIGKTAIDSAKASKPRKGAKAK